MHHLNVKFITAISLLINYNLTKMIQVPLSRLHGLKDKDIVTVEIINEWCIYGALSGRNNCRQENKSLTKHSDKLYAYLE